MRRSTEYKVIIFVSKYGCGPLESAQIWMWDYKTSLHRWDELKVCSICSTMPNILVSVENIVTPLPHLKYYSERERKRYNGNWSRTYNERCFSDSGGNKKFHWRSEPQQLGNSSESSAGLLRWLLQHTVQHVCENHRWKSVKTQVQGKSQRTPAPTPSHLLLLELLRLLFLPSINQLSVVSKSNTTGYKFV